VEAPGWSSGALDCPAGGYDQTQGCGCGCGCGAVPEVQRTQTVIYPSNLGLFLGKILFWPLFLTEIPLSCGLPSLIHNKGEEDRYSTKSKLNPFFLQYSGSLYEYLWTKVPTGSHVSSPGASPSHLVRKSGLPFTKRCARMRSTFNSPGAGSSYSMSPWVVPNWNISTRFPSTHGFR
jgi:hypothetical protein